MKPLPLSLNYENTAELSRLKTLESYDILDTPPEIVFDELARMAASICGTPIALVTLLDGTRQWFKATIGLEVKETPRDMAFCAHAIQGKHLFIVPDALSDPRFVDNPLVTSGPDIRFYAAAPLVAPDGNALGTLCVIDRVARELTPQQQEGLRLLGRHVMAQLELRKRYKELAQDSLKHQIQVRTLERSHRHLDALVREQNARIEQLAQYSAQTGLANRNLFLERLDEYLTSTILGDVPVAVFVMDMQRFALVSEIVGQSHLDELLREVARRLVKVFGTAHEIAHLESDRFAALTVHASTVAAAITMLEKQVLPALNAAYRVDEKELRVAFKVGISMTPADKNVSSEQLLRRANTALVKAKESEEAFAVFTPDLEARVASVVSFDTKLRRAIEQQQFELYYQPKVRLSDGAIAGVEALLRWRDRTPQGDVTDHDDIWIPPTRFVPALEATGLIVEVGQWVLEQAARDQKDWQARGFNAPRIAVNISPLQLRHRAFLGELETVLNCTGPRPQLDIELTEAVLMEQADQCIESLRTIRTWGARVAIDDFGSGYSSLRYLARLPVDVLKIDMAFIHAMNKSPDNMAIVSSIISLAHGLRFTTVAEGVETEEQRALLRLLRCDEIQGYLFSKAISKVHLEALLASTPSL